MEYEIFIGCESLKELTVPDTVSRIRSHVFGFDNNKNPYNDVIIYCQSNSEACRYAREYGVKFITSGMTGDVNKDGFINIADAVILQKFLLGQNISGNIDTDVDGNGNTDAFDMVLMKKIIVEKNEQRF